MLGAQCWLDISGEERFHVPILVLLPWPEYRDSVQFSSRWYVHAWGNPYLLHPIFEMFPTVSFETVHGDSVTLNTQPFPSIHISKYLIMPSDRWCEPVWPSSKVQTWHADTHQFESVSTLHSLQTVWFYRHYHVALTPHIKTPLNWLTPITAHPTAEPCWQWQCSIWYSSPSFIPAASDLGVSLWRQLGVETSLNNCISAYREFLCMWCRCVIYSWHTASLCFLFQTLAFLIFCNNFDFPEGLFFQQNDLIFTQKPTWTMCVCVCAHTCMCPCVHACTFIMHKKAPQKLKKLCIQVPLNCCVTFCGTHSVSIKWYLV